LVAATQRLEESGSETANLDAQVILGHVLGVERAWLFAHYDEKLNPVQTEHYAELVARRATSEPVAYLVGHREFYGLELQVDKRVLIPRPETELLVDAVLDHIESRGDRSVKMVDVGTGSGAIALAVAANCPTVAIYAVDLSPDALQVAQANVERLDERRQIVLLQGDLLTSLPEPVDIIAANLPYIASPVFATLAADVRDFEPRLALEAGPEGLDAIARLLEQAPAHLKPGGVLFLEIAFDQAAAAMALVEAKLPQATYLGLRQDYHGLDRLVVIGL
jgi:release factor glutamine methyltransferase